MIKLEIGLGKWKDESYPRTLIWQTCPNSECESYDVQLHYPDYLKTAQCPDCKTALVGANLADTQYQRIVYHTEA